MRRSKAKDEPIVGDTSLQSLRALDVLYFAAIASLLAALALLASGKEPFAALFASLTVSAFCVARGLGRRSPQPMPFALRWALLLPRFGQSPGPLLKLLQPTPGEHVLDLGAGVGVHAIPVARALDPGTLAAVDVQQTMMDELDQRARGLGVATINTRAADARRLPFSDHVFDAAYLVSVLGEITDRTAAFAELHRVLKKRGRLIVGETIIDPDFVSQRELRTLAGQSGFAVERTVGSKLSYMMLFRPASPVGARLERQNEVRALHAAVGTVVGGDNLSFDTKNVMEVQSDALRYSTRDRGLLL